MPALALTRTATGGVRPGCSPDRIRPSVPRSPHRRIRRKAARALCLRRLRRHRRDRAHSAVVLSTPLVGWMLSLRRARTLLSAPCPANPTSPRSRNRRPGEASRRRGAQPRPGQRKPNRRLQFRICGQSGALESRSRRRSLLQPSPGHEGAPANAEGKGTHAAPSVPEAHSLRADKSGAGRFRPSSDAAAARKTAAASAWAVCTSIGCQGRFCQGWCSAQSRRGSVAGSALHVKPRPRSPPGARSEGLYLVQREVAPEARTSTRRKSRAGVVRSGEGTDRSFRTKPDALPTTKPPSITGAALWELMDRWEVPNEPALRLIAGPPLTSTGKRPRFRLIGEQVERFTLLREIDRHAGAMVLSRMWWK